MSTVLSDQHLVLQEFRLNSAGSADLVAELIAAPQVGTEQGAPFVPLLISVDDRRDVATLRMVDGDFDDADPEQRLALSPFVASWRAPARYEARVVESAEAPPHYYRMAVTESGINDRGPEVSLSRTPTAANQPGAGSPIALLWIAAPEKTHAGLLVLVGHYGNTPVQPGVSAWPLPLSDVLGVRIYEGAASTIESRAEATAASSREN